MTIFVLRANHVIDLITNSSSELFVLKGKTREVVIELLDSVYPNWKNEYEDVKNVTELSEHELETYFTYSCSAHMYPYQKEDLPVIGGFSFDELYEVQKNKESYDYGRYVLKNNKKNPLNHWDRDFVTAENKQEIVEKLSPNKDMWFLFSIDQNPNWEMQEKLMEVAERYHLG